MMARAGRPSAWLVPLLGLIGLTLAPGCARSGPIRYYVLTEVLPASPLATAAAPRPAGAIGVGPVSLPGYLDRVQIVTRRGAELDVAEFDRWGEPLGVAVPRTIAANLAAQLETERVAVFPWSAATPIEHQVVVDVTRFDGVPGGDVLLEARWRVFGQGRKELVLRSSALREATGGSGYPALVAAMNRSLGALSREIADSLRTLREPRR
jgi:uncharacterized lipoprotein YmbA